MLGIIFQYVPLRNSLQYFIERYGFFNHFLLCVLRKTYNVCTSLSLYSIQHNRRNPTSFRTSRLPKLKVCLTRRDDAAVGGDVVGEGFENGALFGARRREFYECL